MEFFPFFPRQYLPEFYCSTYCPIQNLPTLIQSHSCIIYMWSTKLYLHIDFENTHIDWIFLCCLRFTFHSLFSAIYQRHTQNHHMVVILVNLVSATRNITKVLINLILSTTLKLPSSFHQIIQL